MCQVVTFDIRILSTT